MGIHTVQMSVEYRRECLVLQSGNHRTCELPPGSESWKINMGLLEEQRALLTTELFLTLALKVSSLQPVSV